MTINIKSTIRRILKEENSVVNMLFKMSKMIRVPYVQFLMKNGFKNHDDIVIILTKHFKDKYGGGDVEIDRTEHDFWLTLRKTESWNRSDKQITYYEAFSEGDSPNEWSYTEKDYVSHINGDEDDYTFFYINNDDEKQFSWFRGGTNYEERYDNYLRNNWSKAPEWVHSSEFFNLNKD